MKKTLAAIALLTLTSAATAAAYVGGNAVASSAADPFWLYLFRSLWNGWDGFTL